MGTHMKPACSVFIPVPPRFALRDAAVGIAVANATNADKSAADIVLTKPGLSIVVDAIERSREIFQRRES